mgnify:CR=1
MAKDEVVFGVLRFRQTDWKQWVVCCDKATVWRKEQRPPWSAR